MIPDEGRDVQCSNCGHTWFELPPPAAEFGEMTPEDFSELDEAEAEAEVTAETELPEKDTPEVEAAASEAEEEEDTEGSASAAVAAAAAAAIDDVHEPDIADAEAAATTLTPRRPADAASLDILREEAERELSQRRAPPSESIETQTDMGLDEIRKRKSPSRALRARMAHLGEDEDEASDRTLSEVSRRPESGTDEADYAEPRRDLLPDIDEINSTLKPTRRTAATVEGDRNGFVAGFLLMLAIAFAMIIAYAQAPAIVRAVPNAESALISYVDRANAVRDWIAGLTGG